MQKKKKNASFQVFDLYMVVPTQPSPLLSLKVAFYIWTRNYKVWTFFPARARVSFAS